MTATKTIKESDVPVNNAGTGIAGLDNNPPVNKKNKSKLLKDILRRGRPE